MGFPGCQVSEKEYFKQFKVLISFTKTNNFSGIDKEKALNV